MGKPTQTTLLEYTGARALQEFRGTLEQLTEQAPGFEDCWLRVNIEMTETDGNISRKVRDLAPTAVVIHARTLGQQVLDGQLDSPQSLVDVPLSAAFSQYWQKEHGSAPPHDLLSAFDALFEEVSS